MSLIIGKQYLNRFRDTNMRIGIFGGSFNPIHAGHVNLALSAMKILKLDYVMMVIAYNNPYKPMYKKTVMERAIEIQKLVKHPKILICVIKGELKYKFTYQTVQYLTSHLPQIEWFLLMGADNIKHFHKWEGNEFVTSKTKLAVFDRPIYTYQAIFSKTCCKIPGSIYRIKRSSLSSTLIRNLNKEDK